MSKASKMKRVVVGIPEEMLSVIDGFAQEAHSRSEVIRQACSLLIEERNRLSQRERMKVGYQEMGEINRFLAEEFSCDFDCVPREVTCLGEEPTGSDSAERWRKH